MKKCDHPGCKNDATIFGKKSSYCAEHAEQKNLVGGRTIESFYNLPSR